MLKSQSETLLKQHCFITLTTALVPKFVRNINNMYIELWHTLDSNDCKRSELGQKAINCVSFLHISRVNHMENDIKTNF